MAKNDQTRRAVLDSSHIAAAELRAQDKTPNKKLFTFSDERVTGLQIRCQGKTAFWSLRYKDWTKTLGYVFPETKRHISSVSEARDLAQAAKEVLDDNEEMWEPFVVKYYGIRDSYKKKSDAIKAARTEMRLKPTTWTLRQCLEFVIEYRQSAVCPVKERVGKYAIAEWSLTLRREALKDVLDKPVAVLEQGHFSGPRDKIVKDFGVDPANKAMSNIRSSLDYCMRKRSLETGLSQKDQWWLLIESAGEKERETRTPTVEDIVRILIVAEEYLEKPLPGRTDGKHGVRANVYAALWWLVLTAQRTYAGLHIRDIAYFPDDQRPGSGWHLATWSKDVMKANKGHVLPIPPRVVEFMHPLIAAVKGHDDTEWLFPSERGSEDDDVTVGRTAVRQCLQRLAANDPLSKNKEGERKEGFVDFFALLGVPWWTPHDLRRTIGQILDEAELPGGHSAILAHRIESPGESKTDKRRADWLKIFTQDVTRKAYHDPMMMGLKSKAMLVWTNKVLDTYLELKGIKRDFVSVRRNGLSMTYLGSDLHHLQDAILFATKRYEAEVAASRAAVEEDQAAFDAAKKDIVSAVEITDRMQTRLRMSDLSLKHAISHLENLKDNRVDHLLKIAETYNDEVGMRFDEMAVNVKLKQVYEATGEDFSEDMKFSVAKDLPEYNELRRQFAAGGITFEYLKAEAARVYDLEVTTPSVDQDALKRQLAEEFGLEFT